MTLAQLIEELQTIAKVLPDNATVVVENINDEGEFEDLIPFGVKFRQTEVVITVGRDE